MRRYVRRGIVAAVMSGGFVLLGNAAVDADNESASGGHGSSIVDSVVGGKAVAGDGGDSGKGGAAVSSNKSVTGSSGDSGKSGSTGGNTAYVSNSGQSRGWHTSVTSGDSVHRVDRCHGRRGQHQRHQGGHSGPAGNGGSAAVDAHSMNHTRA